MWKRCPLNSNTKGTPLFFNLRSTTFDSISQKFSPAPLQPPTPFLFPSGAGVLLVAQVLVVAKRGYDLRATPECGQLPTC